MRFLSILILSTLPLVAAPETATSWRHARKLAKAHDKDIILFVHGSNWNRLGEKFRTKIWNHPTFQNQLGDGFVTLRIDYLDNPSATQKKSLATATKGLKLKFHSYPVIALYDPNGHLYATWLGSDFPLMRSQALGLILRQQAQRKKRDAFLKQAATQQGIEKAQSLYRAIECNAGLRTEIIKQLKTCDPNNQSGYLILLEFSGRAAMKKANKLADEKKFTEALAWLDKQLNKPRLNTEQKQWILAAKGNVYRRWGKHLTEMRKSFMDAYQLDPQSIIGKAAYRLAKRFAGPPTLEFGWNARHCTASPTLWKVDAAGEFAHPGNYQVTLQYKRGKSSLTINSVSLYDGTQLIHEDKHKGTSGHKSNNNTYHLTVPRKLTHPILHISCHTKGNKTCQGSIQVKALQP